VAAAQPAPLTAKELNSTAKELNSATRQGPLPRHQDCGRRPGRRHRPGHGPTHSRHGARPRTPSAWPGALHTSSRATYSRPRTASPSTPTTCPTGSSAWWPGHRYRRSRRRCATRTTVVETYRPVAGDSGAKLRVQRDCRDIAGHEPHSYISPKSHDRSRPSHLAAANAAGESRMSYGQASANARRAD
jgi:hypothetical protein